nr:MAG TPA: hypothetical protein [Caudoviricetes sp.]
MQIMVNLCVILHILSLKVSYNSLIINALLLY